MFLYICAQQVLFAVSSAPPAVVNVQMLDVNSCLHRRDPAALHDAFLEEIFSQVALISLDGGVEMVTWAAALTVCLWILTGSASGQQACPASPRSQVDFTVGYQVPHFQTHRPIQNIVVHKDEDKHEVYIGSQNVVEAVDGGLKKIWEVRTGPVGGRECQTCQLCDVEIDPRDPVNTDNQVLLVESDGPYSYLYVCGGSQHGLCFYVDVNSAEPEPQCLFTKSRNSPSLCPDCLASPLGTKVTVAEDGATSLFFVAASVDEKVARVYPRRSISVLRPLSTEDGFHLVTEGLTVLPELQNSYSIDYIYSFATKDYVYFLSLQRENPDRRSSALQTRLGRLPIISPEGWMYREAVLECRYEPKRRRRRRESFKDTIYNGLQAAHFGRAGKDLADELGVDEREDMLFGVFAELNERGEPKTSSALCAFSLTKVNLAIESGVETCCAEQLPRGLCHFQRCDSCPPAVSHLLMSSQLQLLVL